MNTSYLLNYILVVINWVIAPAIFVWFFIYSFFLLKDETSLIDYKSEISTVRWLGVIIFIFFVIYFKDLQNTLTFSIPNYELKILPIFFSCLIGIYIPFVCNKVINNERFRWLGRIELFISKVVPLQLNRKFVICILTAFLVSSSLILLFSYLFFEKFRGTILISLFGFLFGFIAFKSYKPKRSHKYESDNKSFQSCIAKCLKHHKSMH